MITWIIEHGFWIGSGLLVIFIFLCSWLITATVRDRRDDGFHPLDNVPPPPPRTSPFARDRHRR